MAVWLGSPAGHPGAHWIHHCAGAPVPTVFAGNAPLKAGMMNDSMFSEG